MRRFFDGHYSGTSSVELLTFYEDFFRHHQKAYLKVAAEGRGRPSDSAARCYLSNPLGVGLVRVLQRARKRLTALLRSRWLEQGAVDEISISSRELASAVDFVPVANRGPVSFTAFCQLLSDPGNATARLYVAGARFLVGYGKYFSRFLHLLPDSHTAGIRSRNATLAGNDVLAEIGGDAYFNGNMHPTLLPYLIDYPGSAPRDDLPCISVNDLSVRAVDRHSLELVDGSGRRVRPVDLGFLSVELRPPLYRLLTWFSDDSDVHIAIPSTALPRQSTEASGLVYRPRFVVDHHIVIARRRWSVSAQGVPRRASGDSEAGFFARLCDWRRSNGIPDEVFASTHSAPQEMRPVDGPVDAARRSVAQPPARMLSKPQYLDFRSPMLVPLYERLVESSKGAVHLEEMLPAAHDLAPAVDGMHAAELVIQLESAS